MRLIELPTPIASTLSHDAAEPSRVLPFVPRGELTFGIYPGGVVETPGELACGKPDLPDEVNRALDSLQNGRHFVVRTYLRYTGAGAGSLGDEGPDFPPSHELARYATNGRKLDLVLSNWDRTGNMNGWVQFIQQAIDRYGAFLRNLQICEEPNLYEYPGDGRFGHSVEAVVCGVCAARDYARRQKLIVEIGFNAVPTTVYNDGFWKGLSQRVDAVFLNALDYVGINLYIDVGDPVVGSVEGAVVKELNQFRHENLVQAGIPAIVPMHISENGWPTGPHRFYTRQAEILESIITKIHELRHHLNIDQFELFALRDADTANPEVRRQFGIMRDDYTPKPAFATYRHLIQQFSN